MSNFSNHNNSFLYASVDIFPEQVLYSYL